jgi:hypothetical protein
MGCRTSAMIIAQELLHRHHLSNLLPQARIFQSIRSERTPMELFIGPNHSLRPLLGFPFPHALKERSRITSTQYMMLKKGISVH